MIRDNKNNRWIHLFKDKEPLLFPVIFFILTFARIWLITGIPKLLIYGPHDDLYFAKAAHYIIYGQWMGPYDQMTLIKTPFYSLFLIASFFTGLPLLITETFFYIIACTVLYFAFSPLIKNHWWRLLLFTFMLYAPASLATFWNVRVYREFVYFSLTLYVVAFSTGMFLRLNQKISDLLLWSLGLGLSMGAFMITREEGVWIYPILFLFLAIDLLFIWLQKQDKKIERSLLILLPIFLWHVPGFMISSLNYSHYGFQGTTEQLDPDFNRVLSTLARIKTNHTWHPAVQTTNEALMQAYKVSPLFNELKDQIEGLTPSWNVHDDNAMAAKPEWYLNQYGNGGSEVSNGHFSWLLRDAVYNKGFYAGGKYPRRFYEQLADQLEAACNNKELDCSPPRRIPFIGSIDRRHYPIILRMFYENALHLLNQDYVGIVSLDLRTWPIWPENNDDYKYFEEFIYNPVNTMVIRSRHDAQYLYLVNGKLDLRLRIILRKEKMMLIIAYIYRWFTTIAFPAGFFTWAIILLPSFIRKRKETSIHYLIISFFILGLFVSRLMTLTIVDATTSASGFLYSASNYIFIYLFCFLVMNWYLKNKEV